MLLLAVAVGAVPWPPAKGPADLPSLAPTNMAALKDLGTLNQDEPRQQKTRTGKEAMRELLPLSPKTDSRYEWRREQNPDRFCIGWDLYNARCYAVAKPEALSCESFLPAATRQLQRSPGYLHGPADDIYHGASGNIHMQTCGSQYKIEIYDGSSCDDTPVSVLGECTPWGVDEVRGRVGPRVVVVVLLLLTTSSLVPDYGSATTSTWPPSTTRSSARTS